VHGGFIQVLNNQVTLITDRAQITEDHDSAKAVAAEMAEAEEGEESEES
jgi:F0F1-type ATP synthase epsilon subunit